MSGEKMNPSADFENRKSQISNRKSPDGPMSQWPDLVAVPGVKMNPFADFENRKSQIANLKWPCQG
jgi:hypothetical protein